MVLLFIIYYLKTFKVRLKSSVCEFMIGFNSLMCNASAIMRSCQFVCLAIMVTFGNIFEQVIFVLCDCI